MSSGPKARRRISSKELALLLMGGMDRLHVRLDEISTRTRKNGAVLEKIRRVVTSDSMEDPFWTRARGNGRREQMRFAVELIIANPSVDYGYAARRAFEAHPGGYSSWESLRDQLKKHEVELRQYLPMR